MKEKDKWYPLNTKSRGDVAKSFNQSLPKEIQTALGKSLTEQFDYTNASLKAKQNELAEKQKQLDKRNKGLLSHRNLGATWTLSPIRSEIRMPG